MGLPGPRTDVGEPTDPAGDEIKRLRGFVDDLVSVQALPAIWNGHEPPQIVSTLLDVLVRVLRLDFAYARVGDPFGDSPIEVARVPHGRSGTAQPELSRAVAEWLGRDRHTAPRAVPNPVGDGVVSIVPFRLGLEEDIGIVVVGAQRNDFPTDTESLLLRVAAQQATVGFQEARRLFEQRRTAALFERRVAERTEQLTTLNQQLVIVNEELRHEIAERRRAEMESLALRDALAAELNGMTSLHELATRLLATDELDALLNEVLNTTIALQNADFGTVQLYNPDTRALEIVAQRGFRAEFLEHFREVHESSAACGRAMQRGKRVIIEDVIVDPDFAPHRQIAASAGFRAVQSTPLFSRTGEILGMISTHFRRPHRPSDHDLRMTDLYARQAAEMIELKRADEQQGELAALVENSPDFIGIASLEGQVQFVNAAGQRLVGLTDDDHARSTTMLDYLREDERERFERDVLPAVIRDGQWEGEFRFRHFHTGAPIAMFHHVFFIKEPGTDRRVALATFSRDMTEPKRAEEALRSAHEELAHVTRVMSMGELTASIAHEVSQPLTAIVTNGNACLRWLGREVPDLEEAGASVRRIISDGNRASDVIRGIRAFSQKAAPQKASLDVNDVVHDVFTLARHELLRHGVAPRMELSVLPPVFGDRIQLQQVLLNLVMNGIESMHATTDWPRELVIGSQNHDAHEVVVMVRDSGGGLAPQALGRLFDAFFTTKAEGIGLGLSISRRIVEAHGGRLWVTPNDDHGVTFCLALPTQHATAA